MAKSAAAVATKPTKPEKSQSAGLPDPNIIVESETWEGLKLTVDRDNGVIPGVKILGRVSKNGREYTDACMAKAAPLYEGARSNIDHGQPGASRSYKDRIGHFTNVRVAEDGLYGDFRFNPKHPLAEQLAWDAENAPQNVGFSHVVIGGKVSTKNGKTVVESIDKVKSVDLVADPATTAGLFEADAQSITPSPKKKGSQMELSEVTLADLKANRQDLLDQLVEEQNQSEAAKATAKQLADLTEENKTLKATEAARVLKEQVAAELTEAKLDAAKVPASIMEAINGQSDVAKRKALIADFAKAATPVPATPVNLFREAVSPTTGNPNAPVNGARQSLPLAQRVAAWSKPA